MRLPMNAGIQQHQTEPADFKALIERPGGKRKGGARKRGAHHLPRIVIAGNADERQLQRCQQTLEMVIFFGRGRIGKIARDHHQVGPWYKFVQGRHTALECRRGIDLSIGQRSRRLDVQVGNLGNENGCLRHRVVQFSGGRRRTASGAIKSPTRSPTAARTVFGASTVRSLPDAPLTTNRCRSPIKLTLSMVPESGAPPSSTTPMVSGRIMATAAGRFSSPPIGCRPPGSTRSPFSTGDSMMLAAPTNSATKRFLGLK